MEKCLGLEIEKFLDLGLLEWGGAEGVLRLTRGIFAGKPGFQCVRVGSGLALNKIIDQFCECFSGGGLGSSFREQFVAAVDVLGGFLLRIGQGSFCF